MPQPLIDVLIPVYNAAAWVRESVESICAQTHRALRIHIVDDGSTDSTPLILAGLARTDDRIRIHRKANGGIVDALNHGLSFCKASYLARHDADDIAYPNRLQAQLSYLNTHPACVAVGAKARHIDSEGVSRGTYTELGPPELADAYWVPAREPYLMHPFLMVRRAAVDAVGGYRSVANSEDTDLYWRIRELGRLHNLPQVLGDYRTHDNSVSSKSIRNGRLMSVSSQLAAISSTRREARRADVPFSIELARKIREAESLQGMVGVASGVLFDGEGQRFELAVAAKLVELASYQPYELETDDCRYIGRQMRWSYAGLKNRANRRALAGQVTRTAVRLVRAKRFADAGRLMPVRLWAEFAMRYAVAVGMPMNLRQRVRSLISQAG